MTAAVFSCTYHQISTSPRQLEPKPLLYLSSSVCCLYLLLHLSSVGRNRCVRYERSRWPGLSLQWQMLSTRRPSNAHRASYYSIEGSAFLDNYAPEIVRNKNISERVDGIFRRRRTTLADIERRSTPKNRSWTPLLNYLWKQRYPLRALLPIVGALLELFLLLYLFCLYYTLPADPVTGAKPPRVSDRYANFPFISCVGSQRLEVYQGLTFAVVILGIASTLITFYFCRDDLLGWQTRRAGLLASVSGAGLSIWTVFAAATPDKHLHLTVTAAKMIVVFGIKTTGMLIDHYDRVQYPALRQTGVVVVMMWWRIITLVIALRKFKVSSVLVSLTKSQ
jgi:hypothetical protein